MPAKRSPARPAARSAASFCEVPALSSIGVVMLLGRMDIEGVARVANLPLQEVAEISESDSLEAILVSDGAEGIEATAAIPSLN
jgi:hypothetical protein